MIRLERTGDIGGFHIKLMGEALDSLTMEQIAAAYQKAGESEGVDLEEASCSVHNQSGAVRIDCEVDADHAERMLNILYPNVNAVIRVPEDYYEGFYITYNGTAFIL